MVIMDHQLVHAAQRLITGANVHHVSTLIFQYIMAVSLHNEHHPSYRTYPSKYEEQLRRFVRQEISKLFDRKDKEK